LKASPAGGGHSTRDPVPGECVRTAAYSHSGISSAPDPAPPNCADCVDPASCIRPEADDDEEGVRFDVQVRQSASAPAIQAESRSVHRGEPQIPAYRAVKSASARPQKRAWLERYPRPEAHYT